MELFLRSWKAEFCGLIVYICSKLDKLFLRLYNISYIYNDYKVGKNEYR